MFIDIHSHIIPGIDDGARSFSESDGLIKQAVGSGITSIVATPHFYSKYDHNGLDVKLRITENYKEFKVRAKKENPDINIFLGSETLLNEDTSSLSEGELLTINGSRYILCEFDFNEKTTNVFRYIGKLKIMGLVPVIAHPERYNFLTSEPELIYRFLDEGCLLQINKGSPTGEYGQSAEKLSLWLLKRELVHCIAGDCHDTVRRNADLSNLYNKIVAILPQDYIRSMLIDTPKRILLDKSVY